MSKSNVQRVAPLPPATAATDTPPQLPTGRWVYMALVDDRGYSIAIVEENVHGYRPCPKFGMFPTFDAAKARAYKENADRGFSITDALPIMLSALSGRPSTLAGARRK
jgi:hypothetical protein